MLPDRIKHVIPMKQANKPFVMSQQQGSAPLGTSRGLGRTKARAPTVAASTNESLGGKDHTPNPNGAPKARIYVDDGSKPQLTTVPGSSKASISEELTRKYRPGATTENPYEKHVGSRPRGVGISHQSFETEL